MDKIIKIYIICPVRRLTEEEKRRIDKYVRRLEEQGYEVRLPYRDTNQDDAIGLRIVEDHEKDIIWADEIHVFWNNKYSEGRLFDFGQARMACHFMPEKKIVLVNVKDIDITRDEKGNVQKSYTNVLFATHFGLKSNATGDSLEKAKKQSQPRNEYREGRGK